MAEAPESTTDSPSARAKALIAALLAVKVLISLWNAVVFDGPSYDHQHHVDRALVGGLTPGVMYYDGPLYYLPALAFKPLLTFGILRDNAKLAAALDETAAPITELRAKLDAAKKADAQAEVKKLTKALVKAKSKHSKYQKQLIAKLRGELPRVLRATNVLYVALFYSCWIWIALPLLLPGARSWFLASTLLLALPGYQKLGAMIHADNLFAATSALCVAVWLTVRRRDEVEPGRVDRGWWLTLPLALGAVGMSRPFAAVPVAVFSAVACLHILAAHRQRAMAALARLAVALAIVGTLSVSWYAYRWTRSGQVTNAYKDSYMAPYIPLRASVNFVDYFTSFRLGELLNVPNRRVSSGGPTSAPGVSNSFFTLLYSETWGDHWLYFSGAKSDEGKLWPKRILFVLALPVPGLLLAGFACSVRAAARRAKAALADNAQQGLARALTLLAAFEREAVIVTWLVLGAALYLYWQTGPALLPGKNSTVKFIYIATLYPLVIILASSWQPSRRVFCVVASYLIALFVAALPIAVF